MLERICAAFSIALPFQQPAMALISDLKLGDKFQLQGARVRSIVR